jgi:hypothetical protein
MKTITSRLRVRQASAAGVITLLISFGALANTPPVANRAAMVGGALPGGSVVSARSVVLTPSSGGPSTAVPIAGDGAFRAEGLAPGHYKLRVISTVVAKQTQGATFGEKVQAGLAQTGSALASGAQMSGSAPPKSQGMPTRISTNLTVGRQPARAVELDGDGVDVEVAADGIIGGIAGGAVAGRQ